MFFVDGKDARRWWETLIKCDLHGNVNGRDLKLSYNEIDNDERIFSSNKFSVPKPDENAWEAGKIFFIEFIRNSQEELCNILPFKALGEWMFEQLQAGNFSLAPAKLTSNGSQRGTVQRSVGENKFLLTFLGKSPNAVAAECPELIEPETSQEKKNRQLNERAELLKPSSTITKWILIQFKCNSIELLLSK